MSTHDIVEMVDQRLPAIRSIMNDCIEPQISVQVLQATGGVRYQDTTQLRNMIYDAIADERDRRI